MNKLLSLLITTSMLLITLFSIPISYAEDDVEYRFERLWPKLEQPWYFSRPSGLTVAPDGSVYIADTENHQVKQFSATGEFIRTIGGKVLFRYPMDIAITPDGEIYVVDMRNGIRKFDVQGNFIPTWKITNHLGKVGNPIGCSNFT